MDKISQEMRLKVTDTTTVSDLIKNRETWNISKLNDVLPRDVVDKIIRFLYLYSG